jgi:Tol biopolymer transport system component
MPSDIGASSFTLSLAVRASAATFDYYVQDIASGNRTRLPLQYQGGGHPLISPDGFEIMFIGRAIKSSIYTIAGEHVRDVEPPNYAVGWISDSRGVFVYSPDELPIKVMRDLCIDLATAGLRPISVDFSFGMLAADRSGVAEVRTERSVVKIEHNRHRGIVRPA